MHLFRPRVLAAFLPWSLVAGLGPWPQNVTVRIGSPDCSSGPALHASTASDADERMRGLSGRKQPLARDEGMLFVFDEPSSQSFWMKDTWIPLSLAFFDTQGRLLSVRQMSVEPDPGHPKRLYTESAPTAAAVEAPPDLASRLPDARHSYLCVEVG